MMIDSPYNEEKECEVDPLKDGLISREPLREPWERGRWPRTAEYIRTEYGDE